MLKARRRRGRHRDGDADRRAGQVRTHQCRCGGFVARDDRAQDPLVLGPHRLAIVALQQHFAHRPPQVMPQAFHRVDEKAVARSRVDPHVERHVGADQRTDRPLAHGGLAGGEQRASFVDGRGPGVARGETRGDRLDAEAQLVDPAHVVAVERGHHEAAAARLADELLLLQQHERLVHRLARHVELLRHAFLRQTLAGCERAVADRVEYRAIGLLDHRRIGGD